MQGVRAFCLGAIILSPCICPIAVSADLQQFTPLDLSTCVTRTWSEFRPWNNWNGPAGGLDQLDGVPFQIDGVIQFRSVTPWSLDDALPTRQVILVGRRVTRIHLLHCSEFSTRNGEPAAKLVLHGADGKDQDFIIRFGVHFSDWRHFPQGTGSTDPNTRYAWLAPLRVERNTPFVTAIWHTALENPRPEVEVASIELRSLFSEVRYDVLAVTTEIGPSAGSNQLQNPQRGSPIVEPAVARLKFLDSDDSSPVAHARVEASVLKKGQMAPWETVETDEQGSAALYFPSGDAPREIEVVATGPRHTTVKLLFPMDPDRAHVIKMHRGKTVGGKVVDEAGSVVPGATVTITGSQPDDLGQTFLSKWPDALTDKDGVWSLGCAPPKFSRLIITVRPSKLLPAGIYEQDDTGGSSFSFRGEALSQGKAVFQVNGGIELKGSITVPTPSAPKMIVTLFKGDTPDALRLTAQADKEGRFRFGGLSPGPGYLAIKHEGFAPVLQKLEITTNLTVINLERGKTLEAIVRDESGRPLGQTLFQATSWRGDGWLEHFGYSDSAGKFRWDSAPSDAVTFSVFHPGCRELRDVALSPGAAPRVFILERQN